MTCRSCWETDCFTVIGCTNFVFHMNAEKLTSEFLEAKPCSEMVTYTLVLIYPTQFQTLVQKYLI